MMARSDFEGSANGDGDDETSSVGRSVFLDDGGPERAKERAEADEHMHRYISDQLERYKEDDVVPGSVEEEFEATP